MNLHGGIKKEAEQTQIKSNEAACTLFHFAYLSTTWIIWLHTWCIYQYDADILDYILVYSRPKPKDPSLHREQVGLKEEFVVVHPLVIMM